MPILMPPAELPPHYHDQIRAQAAAVIVIDVAAVEAGPARPGGYATCQVEGRVTAVERGGQHTAGQPIRLAVPCITPDWDPVPGPYPAGLVSDEIVIALIEERLPEAEAAGGAIFDGFPRTVAQAEALDRMLAGRGRRIDRVIRLKVDDAALTERITRRFAEQGRPDDNPDSFGVRLDAYNRNTAPLLPYYEAQGKLVELDGMGSIESVAAAVDAALAG